MAIQRPPGTRDFYPADMARRNHIFDAWKRVSLRNGFAEMDGPAFEPLELYTAKSGDEIVSQLFTIASRSGDDAKYALRPELTPSLARMVNQKAAALRMPVKWFSIPRLWRGERPQRGRLREFFQWNIDVVGSEEPVADAEVIYTAIDCLRELGLTAEDVVVKVSSRSLLASLLRDLGIADDQLDTLYATIDRKAKAPADAFAQMLSEATGDAVLADRINVLTESRSLDALQTSGERGEAARGELQAVFDLLANFGVADWCTFDLGVVRGLAYYTGPVFEVYDRGESERAICGGGRYDNLLEVLGGPMMPAVGFGMGDVVLANLLEDLGRLGDVEPGVDYFLIDADASLFGNVVELADRLRRRGASAVFSYRRVGVSKQFKQANQASARRVIVVGQEWAEGKVAVKDLASGRQVTMAVDDLLGDPNQPIGA